LKSIKDNQEASGSEVQTKGCGEINTIPKKKSGQRLKIY
jgi:hypothetical protein